MASIPFPHSSAEHPARPPSPSRAGALWSALLARFAAAPVAAPFHDSDFEPQWIEDEEAGGRRSD